jgi:hypothetical protein
MLVDLVADTSELNCARYWVNEAVFERPVAAVPEPPDRRGEVTSFAMPRGIWGVMFASYAMALFMVLISAGYALIYFGTATLMDRVDRASRARMMLRSFDTLTGPLSYGAGFAQILTVPIIVAMFGIAVATIWAVVN